MKIKEINLKLGLQIITTVLSVYLAASIFSCSESDHKNINTKNENFSKSHFKIIEIEDYKVLYVFGNKLPEDTISTYVLYHKGKKRPNINFPACFIQTPVKKIVCLSSIYLGALEKLNELDNLIGVDNKNYIHNEKIRGKINDCKVEELAITGNIDAEKTIMSKPDLIFTYVNSKNADRGLTRLNELGIPTAYCSEQFESDPLQRAEWLKFIAVFFEKDKIADSLFSSTEKNYIEMKEKVSQFIFKEKVKRPEVFSETIYNGTWYVPGGKSFMSKLFRDAGSNYFLQEDNNIGSIPLSFEAVYMKAKSADYWLNVQRWESLKDCIMEDRRNSAFNAYKKKKIYNNTLQKNELGANAYWEKGVFSPDEILKDLIKIFHPDCLPNHTLKYYKKLS